MQKNLLTRTEFAARAGVNASTITRVSKTILKHAVSGKRIDAAHPDAVKYLKQTDRATSDKVAKGADDVLYAEAVKWCQDNERYSATGIQKNFKIGYARAARIVDTMRAADIIPAKTTSKSKPEPGKPKKPGKAARKVKAQESKPRDDAKPTEAEAELMRIPEDIRAFLDWPLRDLIQRYGTDVGFVDWLRATKEIESINEKRLKNAITEGSLVNRDLVKVGVIDPIEAVHIKLLTDGSKTIATRALAMAKGDRTAEELETFVAGQISSHIKPVKSKIARALRSA